MLCSEHTAEDCHRRLVLEYLQQYWRGVIIRHL
jgi:DNA-binding HxlR family transcriptional regulator